MAKPKATKYKHLYVADFETSSVPRVVKDSDLLKENTPMHEQIVWAVCVREVPHRESDEKEYPPKLFNSIEAFFKWLVGLRGNCIIEFHNLGYDGTYIIPALKALGYMNQMERRDDEGNVLKIGKVKNNVLARKSYTYSVDEMGRWYELVVKTPRGNILTFRDSLKLFPMSIDDLGKSIKTQYKDIDFALEGRSLNVDKKGELLKGYLDHSKIRYPNEYIDDKSAIYICKDVAIPYYLFKTYIEETLEGSIQNIPLTIGQDAMQDLLITTFAYWAVRGEKCERQKAIQYGRQGYDLTFPDLTKIEVPLDVVKNNREIDLELSGNYRIIKPYIESNIAICWDLSERAKIKDLSTVQVLDRLQPLTAFDYINCGYRGAFTYVNPKYKDVILTTCPEKYLEEDDPHGGRLIKEGNKVISIIGACVADVNSLYPYVMHPDSGNVYAEGKPIFYSGFIPEHVLANPDKYVYYVRFKTRVEGLNPNHFPFLQIKGNILYSGNNHLETTDYIDQNGKRHRYIESPEDGSIHSTDQVITMYCNEFDFFKETYKTEYIDILDCCVFKVRKDNPYQAYIDKQARKKQEAKGAVFDSEGNKIEGAYNPKTISPFNYLMAKLRMNNIYGKLATTPESNFKVFDFDSEGIMRAQTHYAKDKKAGYIANGAAITANARIYTLKAANANYDCFVYADTDSIHCVCKPSDLKGIRIDGSRLGYWDIEKENVTELRVVRQKTYIEYEGNDFSIITAGMTKASKTALRLLSPPYQNMTLDDFINLDEYKTLQKETQEWILQQRKDGYIFDITKFTYGLKVAGKLMRKQGIGGVELIPSMFEIKEKMDNPKIESMKKKKKPNENRFYNKKNKRKKSIHQPANRQPIH